jgi:hypothetical protein
MSSENMSSFVSGLSLLRELKEMKKYIKAIMLALKWLVALPFKFAIFLAFVHVIVYLHLCAETYVVGIHKAVS